MDKGYNKRPLDIPGDGCGLGYMVFTTMGFKVHSSDSSSVMATLIGKTNAYNDFLSILENQRMSRYIDILSNKVYPYMLKHNPIDVCDFSKHKYHEGSVRFYSHVRDYFDVPTAGIWVSFEHKVFSPLIDKVYGSPHAPLHTVQSSEPEMLRYNISTTMRQLVDFPVIRKEVLLKYRNLKFYPGTEYEKSSYSSFDVKKDKPLGSVLHVVKKTPIDYKEGDGVYHTIIGHEITEIVAQTSCLFLSDLERLSIGIPFVGASMMTDIVTFLPPNATVCYDNHKPVSLKSLDKDNPFSFRYFVPQIRKFYKVTINGVSTYHTPKAFDPNFSMTMSQWLLSTVDCIPPVNTDFFYTRGIIFSLKPLDTIRKVFVIANKDSKEFAKALKTSDYDRIMNVISRQFLT
jgi:hypothetical protein